MIPMIIGWVKKMSLINNIEAMISTTFPTFWLRFMTLNFWCFILAVGTVDDV